MFGCFNRILHRYTLYCLRRRWSKFAQLGNPRPIMSYINRGAKSSNLERWVNGYRHKKARVSGLFCAEAVRGLTNWLVHELIVNGRIGLTVVLAYFVAADNHVMHLIRAISNSQCTLSGIHAG